ncbi:MAG: DNA methyltransferase, partial [Alphaproteobacteria bacterium]
MSPISKYLKELNQIRNTGRATELSYRSALEDLIVEVLGNVRVISEPKKVGDYGHPDLIVERDSVSLGFVETKDIGKNLDSQQHQEQFTRYREGLSNLIITDYLKFRLYQEGEQISDEVVIGKLLGGGIAPVRTNFDEFTTFLRGFGDYNAKGQAIRSPEELAEIMAIRARLLRDIIRRALHEGSSDLHNHLKGFRKILIHDMDEAQFADLYAQTLAYGLFAARVRGGPFDDFDRMKAVELIPEHSPFLRWLFGEVAGQHIDKRIRVG